MNRLKDISWKCLKCDRNNLDDYKCYECEAIDDKCYPSWFNIKYHLPIIKHIVNIFTSIQSDILYKKYEKDCELMDKKYGDYALEDDDFKFIWGIKSWDDLSGSDCNIMTMNDIDVTYDKKTKQYVLGVETAYVFTNIESECKYFRKCLNAFTEYMDKTNLNKNESLQMWMGSPCTSLKADTIEELYTNFRIFVEGFCVVNNYKM